MLQQLQQRKAEILQYLRQAETAVGPSQAPQPRQSSGPVPASSGQQRLWVLEQIEAESPYNCFFTLKFEGQLQPAALEQALQELVTRHESLRTTLEHREGVLWQVIRPPSHWLLQRQNLSAEAQKDQALMRALREEIGIHFDLSQGPLFRCLLIHLDPHTHVLQITMHHCICDGWSVGLMFEELAHLYLAFQAGLPSPLPQPTLQFADWVVWQSQRLQGGYRDSLVKFWKDRLTGAPPLLELPCDHPRPAQQSFAGDRRHRCLPTRLIQPLEALARQQGASLFMVLLAGFYVLLSRYSGQSDLVVGSPVANRNQLATEKLMGFFVNMLVLRQQLSQTQTFLQLLQSVRDMCLEAYHHQELPFDAMVEALNPERSTAQSPLFQVLFAVQNFPIRDIEIPNLTTRYLDFNSQVSKVDLSLYIYDLNVKVWVEGADPEVLAQDGKMACMEFATDLFEGATVERWLRAYQALLEQIVARPDRPLGELDGVLPEDIPQRHQAQTPAGPLLPELLERQLAQSPEAVALVDPEGRCWSYRELHQQANCLAHYLRSRGLGPGQVVAVLLPRSADLLVALLAILKAGAAYLPLGSDLPPQRLRLMCAPAQALLTHRQTAPDPLVDETVYLEELDLTGYPCEAPQISLKRDDLAYIIFTSGSTGSPKGVEVEQGSLAHFLACMRQTPGLGPQDVLVAVTPVTFDISALELFLPLTVGARLVLADAQVAAQGPALQQLLHSSQATVLQATPVTFRLLLESGWQGSPGLRAFCGGEAYGRELAEAILARTQQLWNMYGPTEATIWCAVSPIQPGQTGPIALGPPLPQTAFYVLDEDRRPVPFGARGELYIGGELLARGYWNQPDLTRQRFVPNPLGPGRLYRTGDLVRYRNDGSLEFLGRNDHQIKLRGFRIELGDIESALAAHPQVQECVVQPQSEALHAFAVFRGQPPPEAELQDFLKAQLPPYMVPRSILALPRLPVSANGKIDRKALPVVDQRVRSQPQAYRAPEKELEKQIAAVWKEVLKLDRVSLSDNFFDLGGNSLLLVQAYARLTHQLGRTFPLVDLFAYPNVASLARHLEGAALPQAPARSVSQSLAQRRRQLQA